MLTREQEHLKSAASSLSHPLTGEDWGLLELCFTEGLGFATLDNVIQLSKLLPHGAKDWNALQLRAYCYIQMLKLNTEKAWCWYNLAACFAKVDLPYVVGWRRLLPFKARDWNQAQKMAYCLAESLVIDPDNDDAWDGLARCFLAKASIADLPASFVPMIYSCIRNDAPANLYCTVFCLEKAIIVSQDENKKQEFLGKYQYAKARLKAGSFLPKLSTQVIINGLSQLSLGQGEECIAFNDTENTNTSCSTNNNTNNKPQPLVKRKADYGNYNDDHFSVHVSFSLLNKMSKLDINTLPSTKTQIETSVVLRSGQKM
jgi:hypothetical protein